MLRLLRIFKVIKVIRFVIIGSFNALFTIIPDGISAICLLLCYHTIIPMEYFNKIRVKIFNLNLQDGLHLRGGVHLKFVKRLINAIIIIIRPGVLNLNLNACVYG